MDKKHILKLIFIRLPLLFIAVTVVWTLILRWIPVIYTPLMFQRSIEYRQDKDFDTKKKWVRIEKISPWMRKAVITSEDNLFFEHNGFDFKQIKIALDNHFKKGKKLRGASTISQQTAKNVFLFPGRSFIRKGFEAYFTLLIEVLWGKERILEVYLNVIETGKGIYGVEAAAQKYFNTSAAKLSKRQASLISVCLPNPLKFSPARPSSYIARRANTISSRINTLEYPEWVSESCK